MHGVPARARLLLTGLAVSLCFVLLSGRPLTAVSNADLPGRLSDDEFWRIVEDFSEPNGFFRSDNLVSNEDTFQLVIPELKRTIRPGGAYVGVGPDQNFTYIAALAPAVAFITDIRRGNLHLQLMYKALFELSADRAEFLSRLFARARPSGLGASSSAAQLFGAYAVMAADRSLYDANVREILDHLTKTHGFLLTDGDLEGITYVAASFFWSGPYLSYSNSAARGGRYPTYQDLQMATDGRGAGHSYLSSEEQFRVVQALERSNRVIPLVGNFAGPHALRAIGAWLRARGATVTVLYASNVEQYLFQEGLWHEFAQNVASLPLDDRSTLIRSCFNSCSSAGGSRAVTLLDSLPGLVGDFRQGRIAAYWDVLSRSRR